MAQIVGACLRCNNADAPNVLNVAAAAASITALPDETRTLGAIQARYIQNVGGNRVYYSIGVKNPATGVAVCNATDTFHGFIEAGQALDCGGTRDIVGVYSTGGSTISTLTVRSNI